MKLEDNITPTNKPQFTNLPNSSSTGRGCSIPRGGEEPVETNPLAAGLHDARHQHSTPKIRNNQCNSETSTSNIRAEKLNNENDKPIQPLEEISELRRQRETKLCHTDNIKNMEHDQPICEPIPNTSTRGRTTKRQPRNPRSTGNRRKSEFPSRSVAGSHSKPPGVRRRRNAEQTTDTSTGSSNSTQPPTKRSKLSLQRTNSFGREHAVASTNARNTTTKQPSSTTTGEPNSNSGQPTTIASNTGQNKENKTTEETEPDGFIDINIFPKTTIVNGISTSNETNNITERNETKRTRLDNSAVVHRRERTQVRHNNTEGLLSEVKMGRKHGLRDRDGKGDSSPQKGQTPIHCAEECLLEENDRGHNNSCISDSSKTTPHNPPIREPPNAPKQHNRHISKQSEIFGTEVPKRRLTWERQRSDEVSITHNLHTSGEHDTIDGNTSPQPSTSRDVPSAPETGKRKTFEGPKKIEGHIQDSKRQKSMVSDNDNYTLSGTNSLYSFIYWGYNAAKIGIGANGKPRNPYQRPNYIYFNHGDHLHIVYLCSQRNHTRTIKRIAEDLGANQLDFAAIRTTDIAISRTPTNFILYLIRKGYNTMTIVNKGLQANEELCEFIKKLVQANEGQQPDPNFERCTQYKEEKKLERLTNNRLTDTFIPIIKEHNITTFNELTQHMTQEMLCSFVNQWGPSWSRSAEHLIQMFNTLGKNEIKKAPLWENYANFVDDYQPPEEHVQWMENVFKKNKVDLIEFGAKLKIICEKKIVKLNCFVISGKPNSGKSMITRMLSAPLKPTIVPKGNEQSSFQFQGLIGSTCALLEEPIIWPFNVNSFKTLIGGDLHATDVKNKNQENVERTPFFISTNEEKLGSRCEPIDMAALESRNYLFRFNEVIAHKKIVGTIPRPPGLLSDKLLPWMLLQKADIIDEAFSALLEIEQDTPR